LTVKAGFLAELSI